MSRAAPGSFVHALDVSIVVAVHPPETSMSIQMPATAPGAPPAAPFHRSDLLRAALVAIGGQSDVITGEYGVLERQEQVFLCTTRHACMHVMPVIRSRSEASSG